MGQIHKKEHLCPYFQLFIENEQFFDTFVSKERHWKSFGKSIFFSLPATKFELKHQMQNINKLVPSQTFYSKQFRTSEYVTIFICIAIDDTKSLVIILVSLSNTERFSW